jgi:radical SAM-linked protein
LSHFAVDTERFLGTIPVTARVPWDHIDVGLEDGFLAREYRKALGSRLSPPCGKVRGMFVHHTNVADAAADSRRLVCYDCGVACDLGKMREERIGFLAKMGAAEPGIRARLPVVRADAGEGAPSPGRARDVSPEANRPAQAGGDAERFRLRFSKTGPLALLGHLDLIRELPRVIRRAGVRTRYTRGFHPKPDMTFGPALSLGVASLGEYLDVRLSGAPDPEALVMALNRVAPEGLAFSAAARLGPGDPRVTAVIDGATYVVALARPALAALGAEAGLDERARSFLASESVRIRRNIEGLGKIIDVRAFVTEIFLGDGAARAALDLAGIVGSVVPLSVKIRITSQGSAKISEVVEALTGDAAFPFKAVRTELTGRGGSPMDLPLYRKTPGDGEALPATLAI